MERREFLAGVSISAVAAGTSRFPSILSLEGSDAITQRSISRDSFRRWLGMEFRVFGDDGRYADKMRLLAIEDGPCCTRLEQFSVIFEGTFEEALPEGLWRLTNGKDAAMDLALAPIATGAQPRYRATFNLLLPS